VRTPSATCWRALYSRLRHLALAAAAGRRVSHREKVAAAGREGRLVRRSQAPPVGGRRTERDGSRRPGGPACVPWQPPAGKAGLCADLMRRLLAGALQRELATAGREGQLVCRGNRRPGRPSCVPISCTACWQAPYRERVAAAGREGRLVCRTHAQPVGRRLTERRWQPPAGKAGLCADLMRRLCALQREKPRAPPAGGRRGPVESLADTACAIMSGLDRGP
jgi:hypothetical protein